MASCFACAAYPVLLCVATAPSSQVTFRLLRALCASHQLSATIATPDAGPAGPPGPPPRPAAGAGAGTMKAWRMPGSFLISSRLALTAVPPKTGHFSNTADNMPGKARSMLYTGFPVVIAIPSTPGRGLPMILKSFGSFSFKSAGAGGVSVAARALHDENVAGRLHGARAHTPDPV